MIVVNISKKSSSNRNAQEHVFVKHFPKILRSGSFLKKMVPSGIVSIVTGRPSRSAMTSRGHFHADHRIDIFQSHCLFRAHKIEIRAFAFFDSFIAYGLESGYRGIWFVHEFTLTQKTIPRELR